MKKSDGNDLLKYVEGVAEAEKTARSPKCYTCQNPDIDAKVQQWLNLRAEGHPGAQQPVAMFYRDFLVPLGYKVKSVDSLMLHIRAHLRRNPHTGKSLDA